jgi:hypothetical protein
MLRVRAQDEKNNAPPLGRGQPKPAGTRAAAAGTAHSLAAASGADQKGPLDEAAAAMGEE